MEGMLISGSVLLGYNAELMYDQDIDGRALTFLTPNRPARRYLYLRYVITFLHQQKLGNLGWLNRVEARGYLWATPGPYLRKSMLQTLARRISDQFLPEVFYDSTFTVADSCPQRSLEDEEDLAMGFEHKLQDALDEKGAERGDSDDEEEDVDFDSDQIDRRSRTLMKQIGTIGESWKQQHASKCNCIPNGISGFAGQYGTIVLISGLQTLIVII